MPTEIAIKPNALQVLVPKLRQQFPALSRNIMGQPAAFLDGPAGTQVSQSVIDAISDYLIHSNANRHGAFATADDTEAVFKQAHAVFADFFGADDPEEIFFGANMTSITFAMSRSISQTWQPGDEIILTRLDHDANISPWRMAAEDRGVTVKWAPFLPDDCRLDMSALRSLIGPRTKMIAVGAASNATGGINPVAEVAELAHCVGALCYVDAVHLGPHRALEVKAWNADLVVCSAYKFFGPHVGILWGRRELLQQLKAYKVKPASNDIPEKWMTGTQNHECIAGASACVEYLESIGRSLLQETSQLLSISRRQALQAAFAGISEYENELSQCFLDGLDEIGGFHVYGITDRKMLAGRCSTFSIRHDRKTPMDLAKTLGQQGIFTWAGHYYALEFSQQMGFHPEGMLRIGFVHYNTVEEVQRVLSSLAAAVE